MLNLKKTKVILSSENTRFKHNLEPFFVAIHRKHAKLSYHIYFSIFQIDDLIDNI